MSWTVSQSKQTAVFSVSILLPQRWTVIIFVVVLFREFVCLCNLFQSTRGKSFPELAF